MRGLVRHAFTLLLAGAAATLSAATPLAELSLSALEHRLREIDGHLAQLANYNLSRTTKRMCCGRSHSGPPATC
jgi:hypothetical protein